MSRHEAPCGCWIETAEGCRYWERGPCSQHSSDDPMFPVFAHLAAEVERLREELRRYDSMKTLADEWKKQMTQEGGRVDPE